MQALTGSPDLTKSLATLDLEIKKLVQLASKNVDKSNVLNVSNLADNVLATAEKTTKMLELSSKSSQARIVNIAGRQRMLSQRTAKLYMLIECGFDSKNVRIELDKSRKEFTTALGLLINAPISTPSIRQELDLAKQQWGAFQVSLDMNTSLTLRRNVASTSERLLEIMDSLTSQYDLALKETV